MSFNHLRVHTTYSLAEGAIKVPDLVERAAHMKMSAVALTDTSNLFGAMEFSASLSKVGIQPIIGCQLNVAVDKADPRHQELHLNASRLATDQLIVYAQNQQGYLNLMRMVSQSWRNARDSGRPHIHFQDLQKGTQGLLCLTAGHQGGVGKLLIDKQKDAALIYLKRLKGLFDQRLYVELSRLGIAAEVALEEDLVSFAYDEHIPLIATNEAFFLDPEMHLAHDVLLCIAEGAYVSQEERRQVSPQNRFKSQSEMVALFEDLPEAIENTEVFAQRCGFMVEAHNPILPAFPTEKGDIQELDDQAKEGLEQRLNTQVYTAEMSENDKTKLRVEYEERLKMELEVIKNMGFSGYFLIVADFIKWAKANNIPVGPGRGSGAGSLVAWSLTITDIDPIRFSLIFERFLNPERISMPDFDVDFCQDRRDEVIAYVAQRYGADRVAQIITFGKMQARAVLRDVGRVLQMPLGQVDRICKMIPNNPANPMTLPEAIAADPEIAQMIKKEAAVSHLFDIAKKLEGLYRHASTHAAGVVIGDRPLEELVALYYDPRSEMPATQFNMKDVEKAGLVKFDFLGLKTLTVIQRTIDKLAEKGIVINLQTMPLDDEKTFAMLRRCETVAVFQLESAGMVDVLRRLAPVRFEEIIALVALYRPGPMDDIPRYLACKNGEEKVSYLHPKLQPILEVSFGVMVYQEQVMKIAQELAGYSLGGADLLRRAMGKKIKSEMDAQAKIFVDGCVTNGIDKTVAEQIFEQAAKFASYGFNKSHSAPYALIAYQTAFLKANYPLEFMASVMTLDISSTDKLNLYRQELDRMGVPLYPPDVNKSFAEFSVEYRDDGKSGVRYGLAAIKNIGEAAMRTIVAEREENGPYRDIWNFIQRVDAKALNKRQLENLIVSGAFDSLSPNRKQLFDSIEYILSLANMATSERNSSQTSLFSAMPNACAIATAKLPEIHDWGPLEKLQKEFDAIGFYLTAHPLDSYRSALRRLKVTAAVDLEEHFSGDKEIARTAGVILSKKVRTGKTGKKYAFISVSDPTGVFEFMAFSEHLSQHQVLLEPGQSVYLTISGRKDNESLRFTLVAVESLETKLLNLEQQYQLTIQNQDLIPTVQELLSAAPRGSAKIEILLPVGEMKKTKIKLPQRYAMTAELSARLGTLQGVILEEIFDEDH